MRHLHLQRPIGPGRRPLEGLMGPVKRHLKGAVRPVRNLLDEGDGTTVEAADGTDWT